MSVMLVRHGSHYSNDKQNLLQTEIQIDLQDYSLLELKCSIYKIKGGAPFFQDCPILMAGLPSFYGGYLWRSYN